MLRYNLISFCSLAANPLDNLSNRVSNHDDGCIFLRYALRISLCYLMEVTVQVLYWFGSVQFQCHLLVKYVVRLILPSWANKFQPSQKNLSLTASLAHKRGT